MQAGYSSRVLRHEPRRLVEQSGKGTDAACLLDVELRTRLLLPIRRLERSRGKVAHLLGLVVGDHSRELLTAVDDFRAHWEALDLELQMVTGRPLTIELCHQWLETGGVAKPAAQEAQHRTDGVGGAGPRG